MLSAWRTTATQQSGLFDCAPTDQLLFDASQLRLELLVDRAEAGFDAASAGTDLPDRPITSAPPRADIVSITVRTWAPSAW